MGLPGGRKAEVLDPRTEWRRGQFGAWPGILGERRGRGSVYEDLGREGSAFANWTAASFQMFPWRRKTLV